MKREIIQGSSNVAEIGYSPKNQTLQVKFNSGSIYDYKPVSESMYKELMSAPSRGSFLSKNIVRNVSIECKRVG